MTSFRVPVAMALIFCVTSSAFVPPIRGVITEIFDGRKPKRVTEAVLRHRVEAKPGEVVEIEERIMAERGRARMKFRVAGVPVGAVFENLGYTLEGGGRIESRSRLFLRYLLSNSGDEFLSDLQAEGFVRRDQLHQFKPGFSAEGDPNLWDVRGAYLRHPDIFLHRVRQGVGIAVIGREEGDSVRAVYLDHGLRGVRRLEWRDGDRVATWDFETFYTPSRDGYYPKHLIFTSNGEEKVRSELVALRLASDRNVAEFAGSGGNRNSLTSAGEAALATLLGYR